jgi:hypothetical protein
MYLRKWPTTKIILHSKQSGWIVQSLYKLIGDVCGGPAYAAIRLVCNLPIRPSFR